MHFHFPFSFSSDRVENCIPWNKNTTQQIDLAFNIFFMVYFFIRVREKPFRHLSITHNCFYFIFFLKFQ